MQTVPQIVAQANAVGLVTQREVRDGMVTVRSESAGEHVHAILVGNHPVGYVKERPSGSRQDDVINRERRTLTYLREVDLGPRLLAAQPGGDTLWVGVVRGVDLAHARGTVPELAEVCETWGVAVAQLHRLSTARPGVMEAPRPWLLAPDHRARVASGAVRGSDRAAIIAAIDNEPSLRAASRQVDARWTDRQWMHGDLTSANVVVESAPPMRVRFMNFEHAGLGDPAWDLATAMDTITWMAPQWRTPAEPLIDYFLRGYRRSGGLGTLYPAIQAVRALATAWQLAGTRQDPTGVRAAEPDSKTWLDRARAFAARADRVPSAA
jgi:aminoglycoside phosphotransferase